MPLYTVKDTKTKKITEVQVSHSELRAKVDAGEWEHIPGGFKISYNDTGNFYSKIDTDFRSRLKQIDKMAGKGSKVQY